MSNRLPPLILALTALAASQPFAPAEPVTLDGKIRPVLKEFCFDCHNPQKTKGDLNLVPIAANAKLEENREVWEKIAELMESREMPPSKKPQPTEEQRDLVLHYLDGQLSKLDCKAEKDPGKVTIRRLNKEEYHNTIRDLLGVEFQTDDFPNDEVGYGFDNIGDVLSLSPLLMEKFLTAADEIVRKAIVLDATPVPFAKRLKGGDFQLASEKAKPADRRILELWGTGEAASEFKAPVKGDYVFKVQAYADLAGPELPKLALRIGGKEIAVFEVSNKKKVATYEARVALDAGSQKVAVAFLNDYSNETSDDPKLRGDRNVFVDAVEISGPPVPPPSLPESHKRLITRMPAPGQEHEVAMEVMGRFAKRAYRRPVNDAEIARLAGFVDLALKNGGTFLEGVQASVQAALCSPHFLFRWELDPQAAKEGGVRELGDFEVASRLSYFLWSSMPDAELFALAENGELRKNGNL
jgi:mono/diheme cytochrome c family protein